MISYPLVSSLWYCVVLQTFLLLTACSRLLHPDGLFVMIAMTREMAENAYMTCLDVLNQLGENFSEYCNKHDLPALGKSPCSRQISVLLCCLILPPHAHI